MARIHVEMVSVQPSRSTGNAYSVEEYVQYVGGANAVGVFQCIHGRTLEKARGKGQTVLSAKQLII